MISRNKFGMTMGLIRDDEQIMCHAFAFYVSRLGIRFRLRLFLGFTGHLLAQNGVARI